MTVTSRQRTIQYLHVPLLAQTEHMAVPDEAKGEGGVTFHWFPEDVPGTMVRLLDELVNDTRQRCPRHSVGNKQENSTMVGPHALYASTLFSFMPHRHNQLYLVTWRLTWPRQWC